MAINGDAIWASYQELMQQEGIITESQVIEVVAEMYEVRVSKVQSIIEERKANAKRPRSIRYIASIIHINWEPVHPSAAPYVQAMLELDSITDKYFCDDAEDIVLRFLLNASTWRGPLAREIKAELRAMLPKRR